MPDKNFKDVLSLDFKQNFTLVSVEEGPALHMVDYIQETLRNHANENSKYNVHLLLFAYDSELFDFDKNGPHVFVHDYSRNELQSLEVLFEALVQNKGSSESYKDILVLDDLCMFLIMGCNRTLTHAVTFLRKLRKHFTKVLVFLNKETVTLPEAATFYNAVDALAVIRASTKTKLFTCDLIKMKPAVGAKVRHESSHFEVIQGQVKVSIQKDNSDTNSSEDVLKNLTTFKLTLEEDEKESKSRLHLPYFDAQKTTVSDVSPNDYFDDDDEEEEP